MGLLSQRIFLKMPWLLSKRFKVFFWSLVIFKLRFHATFLLRTPFFCCSSSSLYCKKLPVSKQGACTHETLPAKMLNAQNQLSTV